MKHATAIIIALLALVAVIWVCDTAQSIAHDLRPDPVIVDRDEFTSRDCEPRTEQEREELWNPDRWLQPRAAGGLQPREVGMPLAGH